jgi:hypothetical protein
VSRAAIDRCSNRALDYNRPLHAGDRLRALMIAGGLLMGCVTLVEAQPMMCGTGIVDPGFTQEQVLEMCGQPEAARSWVETVPAGDDWQGYVMADQIPMAEWVYQNGFDQFVYKVMFQNGVVQEIRN